MVAVYSATRGPGPDFADSYLVRQFAFVVVGAGVDDRVSPSSTTTSSTTGPGCSTAPPACCSCWSCSPARHRHVEGRPGLVRRSARSSSSRPSSPSSSLIVALAFLLVGVQGRHRPPPPRRAARWWPGVPMALIMLQPDLGTAAGVHRHHPRHAASSAACRRKYLAVLVILVGVVGVVGVLNSPVLKEYQKERLTAFVDPETRPAPRPLQRRPEPDRPSPAAGMTGQGLFEGPQTQLGFVPEQQTDFIFTVGGRAARLRRLGHRARPLRGDHAGGSGASRRSGARPVRHPLCVGVLAMFVFSGVRERRHDHGHHAGHRHPPAVLSYGGSSTLTAFAGIGLVLNVHMRRFR